MNLHYGFKRIQYMGCYFKFHNLNFFFKIFGLDEGSVGKEAENFDAYGKEN